MKCILVPNPDPPYNLMRFCPAYGDILKVGWSEAKVLAEVIYRNQKDGRIPYENQTVLESARAKFIQDYPNRAVPNYPTPGPFYVVEVEDLPGGSVSEANDRDYFFDAWEWSD